MLSKHLPCAIAASLLTLLAADQGWRDKKISEWSEDDAKTLLSDSPWSKSVSPDLKSSTQNRGSRGGRGGRGGGIGMGVPGIGGIGMPRGGRGGMGGPGGGRGDDPYPSTNDDDRRREGRTPPQLTVRWESARIVQDAELKAKITDAPTVDEGHYAVAVIGVPSRMLGSDGRSKLHAELKTESKKTIKSSDTRILSRDDGVTVLFLFPRTKEISQKEREVTFKTSFERMDVKQTFDIQAMFWDGKLDL